MESGFNPMNRFEVMILPPIECLKSIFDDTYIPIEIEHDIIQADDFKEANYIVSFNIRCGFYPVSAQVSRQLP